LAKVGRGATSPRDARRSPAGAVIASDMRPGMKQVAEMHHADADF
jgi:hypothetical protein